MPKTRYNAYIICTSPRSGSTLLCKLLAATGKSGHPDSHFHTPAMSGWLKAFGLSRNGFTSERDALHAVFNAARRRGTGKTGVFGLRLQRGSFDFFMQQVSYLHPGLNSDTKRLQAAFGHTLFIHLTRPNKLGQAISFVKATQSGLWHRAADGTELERLSAPQKPVFDADEISRQIAEFTALDDAWRVWFGRENVDPLQVTYDQLSADPTKILASILEKLGLDRGLARGIRPPTARLADATSQIWAERFLAERGDRQNL